MGFCSDLKTVKLEMAALETLERDYPLIDFAFRGFCSSLGIFSVEDFLLYDSHALEDRLERAPEKFKQGMLQLYSVVESYHRPWLNGLELLEDVEQNKFLISTGCEGIDTLLQGGVRIGQLTELVGPPSSGKTQVCLKTASHVAQEYSSTVLYVDTSNSFSPKQVVGFLTQSSTPVKTEKTVEQVLRSIACHRIFDIFSLLDMLHLLKNQLKSQIHSHVKMLIIDSLSSLIAPILGGGSADGHALMITVSYMLKELAHEHNISVMFTNHMVAGEAGTSKPALGEHWKSIPHVRVLLSKSNSLKGSCITLLKHPYMATGKVVEFRVP